MTLLLLALIPAPPAAPAAPAAEGTHTLYVQLVLASNKPEPGSPNWKKVGPKLSRTLSPVFRWTNFWEVSRRGVAVGRERETAVQLAGERKLLLRVVGDNRMDARYFWKGELRRKVVRDLDGEMTVLGGETEDQDGWFIVVRRDKPTLE